MRKLFLFLFLIINWQSYAQLAYHIDTSFRVDLNGNLPCVANFSDCVFDDDGKIGVTGKEQIKNLSTYNLDYIEKHRINFSTQNH